MGRPVDKVERSHPDSIFLGAKSIYDRAGFREVTRRRRARPVRSALRPEALLLDREPRRLAVVVREAGRRCGSAPQESDETTSETGRGYLEKRPRPK